MVRYRYLVFSNPVQGREAEYNAWYDHRHLGDVLATPGFVSAQRFRCADGEGPGGARYLAMYELASRDPGAALKRLRSRANSASMLISPALDLGTLSTSLWLPRGDR
nr:DUF4286 family protein [Pseudomonas citronellolis]